MHSLLVGGASIAAVYGTHLSLVLGNTERHQTAVREYPEASGEKERKGFKFVLPP